MIISHDRELLKYVDVILELSNRGLTKFGGNWTFYEEQSRLEWERLSSELEKNKRNLEKSNRDRHEKLLNQEKRSRHGKADAIKRGLSRIEVSGKKRQAQVTQSQVDKQTAATKEKSQENLKDTLAKLKLKPQIYAEFPETEIPNSKLVFQAQDLNFTYPGATSPLWATPLNLMIRGPEKVAIQGANGSGKSTLLKLMIGCEDLTGTTTGLEILNGTTTGRLSLGNLNFKYIDQNLSIIAPSKTVLEIVESHSNLNPSALRNLLAQFLFTGDHVHQVASTLSGGEKVRLALAMALLSSPAPQLLILDEPTNNIDIANLEFLEAALSKFKGALIIVSHDLAFLENIGIDRCQALFPDAARQSSRLKV